MHKKATCLKTERRLVTLFCSHGVSKNGITSEKLYPWVIGQLHLPVGRLSRYSGQDP